MTPGPPWATISGVQELLPYFCKLENDQNFTDEFHGNTGPIITHRFARDTWLPSQVAFYEACRAAGFPDCADHNHPESTGVGPTPFNNPNGIRYSTAVGHLSQARHRLNLTIQANCLVHRLLFNGTRATGVEVERGGETFVVTGNEIILSAGAIGSPHILLLSGVGPARQLTRLGIPVVADLPGVGKNLRDHPLVWVTWRTRPDFPLDGKAPRMQVCLRYTAEGSHLRNDMKISMQSFATERINRGGQRMDALGIRMTAGIQLALGQGELSLTSTDPKSSHSWITATSRRPLTGSACGRPSASVSRWLNTRVFTISSLSGLSRPTPTWRLTRPWMPGCDVKSPPRNTSPVRAKWDRRRDPLAVVDQFGRVHGLDNLRVVDASIMPDCIRANTNVTTMMIGERIADFIRQEM